MKLTDVISVFWAIAQWSDSQGEGIRQLWIPYDNTEIRALWSMHSVGTEAKKLEQRIYSTDQKDKTKHALNFYKTKPGDIYSSTI